MFTITARRIIVVAAAASLCGLVAATPAQAQTSTRYCYVKVTPTYVRTATPRSSVNESHIGPLVAQVHCWE